MKRRTLNETPSGERGETRREKAERFGMAHMVKEPEVPASGRYIWNWFWRLSNMRNASDSGPAPIRPDDIVSFSRVTGEQITREEIDVLLEMDIEYRNAIADLRQEAEEAARAKD